MKTYNFFEDGGHGWLEVDFVEIVRLGIASAISNYSYMKRMDDGSTKVYLEEDCDYGHFYNAMKNEGKEFGVKEIYQDPTPIRNYLRYSQF